MTISRIIESQVIDVTGVTEKYHAFDNTKRVFNKDQILIDGDYTYKRVGDDLYIPDFDSNKKDYKINDIVYKDSKVSFVNDLDGKVAKQPEEYASIDVSYYPTTWSNRYLKLGTLDSDGVLLKLLTTYTDDIILYKFTKDTTSNIIYITIKKLNLNDNEIYSHSSSCGDDFVFGNLKKMKQYKVFTQCYDYITDFEQIVDDFYTDGNNIIKKGTLKDSVAGYGGAYSYYTYTTVDSIIMQVKGDTKSYLNKAEEEVLTNDNFGFVPRYIINRNGTLYTRTNVNPSPQLTKTIYFPEAEPINSLTELEWGWSKYYPTNAHSPFDNKQYTYLHSKTVVTYKIKSKSDFNIIAFNGILAEKVDIKISGALILSKSLTCENIIQSKSLKNKVTEILYLNDENIVYEPDTIIEIVITPLDNKVILGGLYLGNSIVAGITDPKITNRDIDYGKYEKDAWGNISYTEGVKVRVLEGSATFELKEYDVIGFALQELKGKKIIFDGSDNFNNAPTDSENFFASTSMIGRIKDFSRETVVENGKLKQIARYSFKIEEDV